MIDDLDSENWVTSMVHLGWRTKNLCWPYFYVSNLEDILFMGLQVTYVLGTSIFAM